MCAMSRAPQVIVPLELVVIDTPCLGITPPTDELSAIKSVQVVSG